jgi:hypothetical protein
VDLPTDDLRKVRNRYDNLGFNPRESIKDFEPAAKTGYKLRCAAGPTLPFHGVHLSE